MMCIKYGMDASHFDFTHAPEYFENMEPQEVRAELSKVRDAANAISGRMAKVLEQDRNINNRQQTQDRSDTERKEQTSQESYKGEAR